MKPDYRSRRLLSITQAKAKMYEYDVPVEEHIAIERDPAYLFPLSIGMLGDGAAEIIKGNESAERIRDTQENLPFSARFFDAYKHTLLNSKLDPYSLVIGAAAYYLSDLPGSSKLLANIVDPQIIDLEGHGLDKVLTWILRGEYSQTIDLENSPFREMLSPIMGLIQQYYATGNGAEELLDRLRVIRNYFYQEGTPRQLLFGDLIGALIHKRLGNSTWACIPGYSGLPTERWVEVFHKASFIRELWPAQHRLGEKGIYSGTSAIVQMPTSAGKTKAIEIILRSSFLAGRATLAVIVAPYRALCHEIRDNLKKAFRGEAIFVNELSDTLQIDYSLERLTRNNQIVIVTPEKLNYVLRHTPELAGQIGLLIYDEGHQFDNGTRGITYELLLTSLKSQIPDTAQTILISAVISNAQQVGQWLLGEHFETVLGTDLQPTYRSVAFASWPSGPRGLLRFVNPLDIDVNEFYVPRIIQQYTLEKKDHERKETNFPERSDGKEIALYLGLKLVRKGTIAIFCGQKGTVTGICSTAVNIFDRSAPLEAPQQVAGNREEIRKLSQLFTMNLGAEAPVTKSAALGIFAHHNNIPYGIRQAVEYAIKEGLASFVVCTSTLAQGVNLPIRYLFVTSVYQGGDQIKVRDFQNLIGRSGRSDQHTEGSIIFPAPEIFDEHEQRDGQWRWNKAKELLNPSESEPCTSSLYSIFDKLRSDDGRRTLGIDPFELIAEYNQDYLHLQARLENIATEYSRQKFTVSGLLNQVAYKTHLITAIESYLMAHWDDHHSEMDEDAVSTLAKGTLAYFMADQNQKEQIVRLFILIANNIVEKVPDVHTRIIFGRTLFGLQDSLAIANWLTENIDQLISIKENIDLLRKLWPLFTQYIHTRAFKNCDQPGLLEPIAVMWIEGYPFSDMHHMLVEAGAKIIAKTKRFHYKIEDIVDICENGFAYDGMLLIGAAIELLQEMRIDGVDQLNELMMNFQKQIKYGLYNPTAIALYELGFSDRFIAMDLSTVFDEAISDKELVIQALRGRREQVFDKLNAFPSYFSEVYRIVAT